MSEFLSPGHQVTNSAQMMLGYGEYNSIFDPGLRPVEMVVDEIRYKQWNLLFALWSSSLIGGDSTESKVVRGFFIQKKVQNGAHFFCIEKLPSVIRRVVLRYD